MTAKDRQTYRRNQAAALRHLSKTRHALAEMDAVTHGQNPKLLHESVRDLRELLGVAYSMALSTPAGTMGTLKNNMNFAKEQYLPVNPFSNAYWQAELEAYNLRTATFHVEHVKVDWFKIQGRCDDYLNVNMRFDDTLLPSLSINGHLWMSLTPMEIQSAALAIYRAKGRVLCGGLGLGYFALRAAAKPEVTEVVVFEREPSVIEWFLSAFKDRPELAKIKLIEGDMRKTCKGYEADFAYVDIYPDMLCDSTFKDARYYRKHNKIKRYMFWGYERIVLGLMANKLLKYGGLLLGNDLIAYFRHWQQTPMSANDESAGTLANFYRSQDSPPRNLLLAGRRVMADFPL